MLQTLRSGAAGWVAKIFLGLLVLSFAVWGIEDIFRIRSGGQNAAVIGERNISVDDFRNAYNNEIRRISNQARRVITPEQARMAGVGERVLGDLINEAAMDAKVRDLKLALSDDEVAREIQNDDMFQGASGGFDRTAFNEILRQNNLNEARYIELQRAFSVRKHVTDALMVNLEAPEVFRQAIHAFNSDSRSISYIDLKAEEPAAVPAPSADALKTFYESRKASFSAPEYRKVAFVSLDPKAIADKIEIPDADLRAYYDANQPKADDLEKRSIEQIPFPSMKEAQEAYEKVRNGTLFEQVMAERKLKPADIYLGDLTRSQMVDRKVAEAAFRLSQGQVSAPVQGDFSVVLLRVTGIKTEEVKTFEQTRDEIRGVMAEQRARQNVLGVHDKIDEARLGGANLEEVAKANGLELRTLPSVDADGKAPDGSTVADLPMSSKLIEAAFRTEPGATADTLSEGDAYVWIDVLGVTPPRERTFDEARAAVERTWRTEEVAKRLNAKADGAVKELNTGKPIEQVASALKLEVDQAETTRLGGAPSITAAQARAVFETPVDQFGQTPADEKGGRLVYKVTAENDRPFDPSKADDSGQIEKISQSMGNDMVSALVRQLRDALGTTIDPAAVAQVTGAPT